MLASVFPTTEDFTTELRFDTTRSSQYRVTFYARKTMFSGSPPRVHPPELQSLSFVGDENRNSNCRCYETLGCIAKPSPRLLLALDNSTVRAC